MAGYIPRVVLFLFVISLWFGGGYGFFWPSSWWGDDESGESSARNGWTPWIEFEDSSDEGDSSVDLEDLVLTISLDGPPKTAKPTTLATTTTDSATTTKPKPKPPPKG
uniref:Uncharacterized protein n=1 Tax=Lygus hesperus TaxID=30085 RepID=A0A146LQE3_LYGHE